MPSIVTSIIGGFQGSSAAHNAASAQEQGYSQAAQSVNNAVGEANPIISGAAGAAGAGVSAAAGQAAQGATTQSAGAASNVTNGAFDANQLLYPYFSNGTTASNNLRNLTSAGFSFDPSQVASTPGYQFSLQQGQKAIDNSMAVRGLGTSGAAIKAGDTFAQNLAQSTYQQAFNNALTTYGTNVSSLLPQAQLGLNASGAAGSNLMGAAEYAGNINENAAQYAGNTGMAGAQYSGNAGMWGAGTVGSNLINAGVYQGNTQIGAGNAAAQGDVGAANAWNSMLGGIGNTLNSAMMMGFPAGGGGWSLGNIGTNLGNLYGAGGYNPAPAPTNTFQSPEQWMMSQPATYAQAPVVSPLAGLTSPSSYPSIW